MGMLGSVTVMLPAAVLLVALVIRQLSSLAVNKLVLTARCQMVELDI